MIDLSRRMLHLELNSVAFPLLEELVTDYQAFCMLPLITLLT